MESNLKYGVQPSTRSVGRSPRVPRELGPRPPLPALVTPPNKKNHGAKRKTCSITMPLCSTKSTSDRTVPPCSIKSFSLIFCRGFACKECRSSKMKTSRDFVSSMAIKVHGPLNRSHRLQFSCVHKILHPTNFNWNRKSHSR